MQTIQEYNDWVNATWPLYNLYYKDAFFKQYRCGNLKDLHKECRQIEIDFKLKKYSINFKKA
jgi:hypothetical protein